MRIRTLFSIALASFFIALSGLGQKIYADSDYPETNAPDNLTLFFIIAAFVIVIILISIFILTRIRSKHDMKDVKTKDTKETTHDD